MRLTRTTQSKRFETEALPHLGALYRMARQLAGPQEAEDIVQETFLRAWKYFETFASETNCRAWLFRILRNTWISRWRKNRLELPLNYPIVLGNDATADKFGGLVGLPTSVLISKDGRVVKRVDGLVSYDEIDKAIQSQF